MTDALLIGQEPKADLGFSYVTQPPYDVVVIGSLTLGQLLEALGSHVLFTVKPQGHRRAYSVGLGIAQNLPMDRRGMGLVATECNGCKRS